MQFKLIGLAAVAAFGAATCVHAKDDPAPRVLQPTSDWILDYADDSCKLSRKFGSDDDTLFLTMTQMGPGDSFDILIAGKQLEPISNRDMKVNFGSEGETEARYLTGTGDDGTVAIAISKIPLVRFDKEERLKAADGTPEWPQVTIERANTMDSLTIRSGIKGGVMLTTGPLGEPVAAMRKCIDELLTHWGIDLAAHAKLTRHAEPKGNPGNWVVTSDYPKDMLRKGYSASVNFRLSVDAAGRPTQCHVQQVIGDEVFAEKSCEALMRRARFRPALGADGTPIASFFRSTVRFQT